MTTLNLLVLLLSVLGSARAETFIGYGTIVHDSVSQWGGALRSFGCQFNTTSAYFAENFASMNRPQWDGSAACGRCIKVWCTDARCTEQDASKVLQIVDQCGHCQEGDIGMSASAFKSVTGTRQENLKVSWEWAECAPYMDQPNILFTPKTDGVSAYWQALNFANLARPLKSVAANGNNLPRTSWNNWVWTPQSGALDLNAPLALTLTSDSGETVSTTVNQLEQQWLDIQFSANIPDIAQPTNPPSPSVEPPPSPSVEPSPSPSVEPSPSPSVEPSPSPAVEPSTSPIVEPSPSPSVEPSPSPSVEPSPSPVVEPSTSPIVEPSPSPSVEPSPSPIVEPSPSPIVEPSPSPSVEPSPSPIVEPSPSPSMDPSPSPPVQPSPSPSSSPSSPPPSAGGGQLPAITAEYGKVLGLSWWFYEAQRSGKLPPTNRVPWRGDSHLNDKVPGGWYDAGDHLKLNFPLATTATFLSWGVIEFGDAYSRAGELQHAQEGIRWVADYLMACHYDTSSYIGQIGDPGPDHAYWGRPEEQTGPRPFYVWDASKPGSDLIGAAASALASASIVFKASDPEYAQACLFHATQLYTLASQHEGKYSDSIPSVTYVYMSANYLDDLAFAAAWLYRATGDAQYLDASQKYLKRAQYQRNYFVNWDSVFSATDNLLLSMGVKGSEPVNGDIEWHFTEFLKAWQQGKHGMKFSPKGLAVAPLGGWGNLRHSSNAAFMMVLHAKYTSDQGVRSACLEFAKGQIDYMLGSTGRSYVVGYGNNPPTSPHHRAASCPDRPDVCNYDTAFKNPGPNPQILYGALVGGPNDQDVYEDKRSDYVSNEVAVDYNAGFTGTLAGLVQLLQ